MRVVLIVMANVFVAVVSVLGVNEFFGLRRYASFTAPFTDKMVGLGVIAAEDRDRLLREDRMTHLVGIVLSLAAWAMLGMFIAGVSAVPVFLVVSAVQLVALKPDMEETSATRAQYYSSHKSRMDALKYHAYLESVGEIQPTDSNEAH